MRNRRPSRLPGFRWRVLAHERGGFGKFDHRFEPKDNLEFDELVVGKPCFLHVEQMDFRDWWIGVGNPHSGDYWHVNVHVNPDGSTKVYVENQNSQAGASA